MKINQISFKQDKNEAQLTNKAVNVESLIPTPNNITPAISLYDSDWIDVLPEDIDGATSQVENYELPQKVPFEFSFNLEVPEVYLPFVNIAILAKPSTNQKVIGAGQFVFSGLQEVLLTLYRWLGTTSFVTTAPGWSGYTYAPISAPPVALPPPTIVPPPPTGCYTKDVYWTHITVNNIGGGPYGYDLTPDGLWVNFGGGIFVSLLDFTTNIWNTWHPLLLSLTFDASQSYGFKHQAIHFPVPDGQTLPCGSTTPPSGYPDQRWESEGQSTFQDYMNLGYTYTQAKALFTKYYPEIFITPESHGIPYKCYQRVNTDTVVSGDEKIKITKTDAKNFQFSVYGNLLLVSPAIIETTWSDPDFPTYKPDSTALSTRLKIFFKEHPINFIQTKVYR